MALFTLKRPAVVLGLVFCNYGLQQFAKANSPFYLAHNQATNIITGASLCYAVAVTWIRNGSSLSKYPRVGRVTLALFAYAALSIIWSVYQYGTMTNLKKIPLNFIVFLLLPPLLIVKPTDLRDAAWSLLGIGSLLIVLITFTTDFVGRSVSVVQTGAAIGSVIDKEDVANPLAIASMAGYVAITALLMNFQGVARAWQLLRWLIVFWAMIIEVKSGSRGQLFATLLAILFFLPLSRRIKNLPGFIATFFGVAVLSIVMYWVFSQYVIGTGRQDRYEWDSMYEDYQGGRIETAKLLLSYWLNSNPLYWIIGLGSSASFKPDILGFYPHLVMVEVLCELGLIGFCLLWAVVVLTFQSIKRLYPLVAPYPDARGLLATFGCLFLFDVILSFKQGSMLGSLTAFSFAIILGRFELAVQKHQAQ